MSPPRSNLGTMTNLNARTAESRLKPTSEGRDSPADRPQPCDTVYCSRDAEPGFTLCGDCLARFDAALESGAHLIAAQEAALRAEE